ncbi:reverse transcriptase domain-containing protein [Tanacetum coccineum]
MFDEYFNPIPNVVSLIPATAAPSLVDLTYTPLSTCIEQDAPTASTSSIIQEIHSPVLSEGVEEQLQQAPFDDDPFLDILTSEPSSQESSLIDEVPPKSKNDMPLRDKSSKNELFTPCKEPEREFRSSRRNFKTLSLDELRSVDFNLLSDQEYLEEEVVKTMPKTMKQYMRKTRADYGSGVARPKIEDKDNFELKGQFLKELCTNTFSGSDHEYANEHIEKVLEIVDLFHIPNITIDQVMLRAFPMSLTRAASHWLRNEPTVSITTWDGLKTKFLNKYCPPAQTAKKMEEINNFQQEPDENLYQAWEQFKELLIKYHQHYLTKIQEVILFYNGFGIPTRQILDSRGAIPSKTVVDAKVSIQEMVEYSQKWHNETSRSRSTETSDGLAAIQAQLNNLRREIKKVNEKVYAAQVGCE